MFVTQQSMILAKDLSYGLEGTDSETLKDKKHKGRYLYICFLDKVGEYYTSHRYVEITKVRFLEFALIMMAQASSVTMLMQNVGVSILLKPAQNAFIERFNRMCRTEILDIYLFRTLNEARETQNAGWANVAVNNLMNP